MSLGDGHVTIEIRNVPYGSKLPGFTRGQLANKSTNGARPLVAQALSWAAFRIGVATSLPKNRRKRNLDEPLQREGASLYFGVQNRAL